MRWVNIKIQKSIMSRWIFLTNFAIFSLMTIFIMSILQDFNLIQSLSEIFFFYNYIVEIYLFYSSLNISPFIQDLTYEFYLCFLPGFFLQKEISPKTSLCSSNDLTNLLDPYFVTGFSDAEGSFIIFIGESKINKIRWKVEAKFQIGLHSKDTEILYKIQKFFKGVGTITFHKEMVYYQVRDIKSIKEVIVPHFEKYLLRSAKSIDFLLFQQCIMLISNKEHLTQSGLDRIIAIKAALNLGLSDKLKLAFPHIIPIVRPDYILSEDALDPHWVTGFTEGDGSFIFYLGANEIKATYSIHLHKREEPLLIKISEFFGSKGYITLIETQTSAMYRITAKSDLNKLVIPHFDKYKLLGAKLQNYTIWRKMVELIINKLNLTEEGLAQLKLLKSTLNKN